MKNNSYERNYLRSKHMKNTKVCSTTSNPACVEWSTLWFFFSREISFVFCRGRWQSIERPIWGSIMQSRILLLVLTPPFRHPAIPPSLPNEYFHHSDPTWPTLVQHTPSVQVSKFDENENKENKNVDEFQECILQHKLTNAKVKTQSDTNPLLTI